MVIYRLTGSTLKESMEYAEEFNDFEEIKNMIFGLHYTKVWDFLNHRLEYPT